MANELTPEHSEGFGPAEDADASRQSQHSVSNDAQTDVNYNAVVCREQSLIVTTAGRGFVAAQERRQMLADAAMGKEIKG